jgi:hypothetical protein
MSSGDIMPVVAEPSFMPGAKVERHHATNINDLKKGIQNMSE